MLRDRNISRRATRQYEKSRLEYHDEVDERNEIINAAVEENAETLKVQNYEIALLVL